MSDEADVIDDGDTDDADPPATETADAIGDAQAAIDEPGAGSPRCPPRSSSPTT